MNRIRISLLAMLALPLAAQDTGFSAGGGFIVAPKSYFGGYDKAVNNTLGYYVNGAYKMGTTDSKIAGRAGLTIGFMPGKERDGLKTSLTLYQVSGDLVIQTSIPSLSGVVGVSVNSYSASFSGVESQTADDTVHHFPFKNCKGIKGGLRLGLEYSFTKHLSGDLLFQQTELAGQVASDSFKRAGGINPAWLQLGLSYKF
jgi:hypothetical protein